MSRTPSSHIAYIAVGSNIGDKRRNCLDGLERLTENGQIDILAVSGFYKTEPVDYIDQEWFVNAVAKIGTRLDPFDLLKAMTAVEVVLGRRRDGVRFGPRVIDLDIIFYDHRVIDSAQLVVPHPRMHKRRFVLAPICDIDPELLHPVLNVTMKRLLEDLDISGQDLTRLDENT
jgi:2-amino-4-hydroxy-6-hydroxymethyldihydropteridine diphosphokinase